MFWKKFKIFVSQHYQKIAVYLAAFLLLFLGGLRFNPLSALFISLVDTLCLILLSSVFNWLFSKKSFKFRLANVLAIILILFVSIQLLFLIEYFIWDRLFFYDHTLRVPYAMFKDIFIVLGAFIASLITYSNKQRKQAEKLDFEKQALELRFLKSQINPHFVFNVLNNIYTLVYTKSDQAPEAVLKLADMLRYVTDEFQVDTIPIEKELKYIENYIDLQIMRIGHHDNLTIEYDIDDYGVRIPPMILQPVIENSFKYSDIDTNKNGQIFFSLKIKNSHLTFTAFNTKKNIIASNKELRKGVGISNIEQRLKLYYKKGYSILIENEKDSYKIQININLSNNKFITDEKV